MYLSDVAMSTKTTRIRQNQITPASPSNARRIVLEAFALQPLALHLPGAANSLGSLAGAALRRLFEMAAQLHLAKNTFALHLLLQRLERLIDIVVANENLHLAVISYCGVPASA